MTKSSKSTAMIRRRKNKPTYESLSRMRKHQPVSTTESGGGNSQTVDDAFFHKEVLRSSVIAKVMSSEKTIFLGLVVIRLVNALLMQTSFVPDEFWQSMEVAHNMVFDDSYGYITWEWRAAIRSYAYPLLIATLYKLLAMLGLDYRGLLIRGPRLLQGLIASAGDLYLYRLSCRLAGREVGQWALLCQLLSWFTAYCCTRTLSNGVETTLVTAALYYFPWPGLTQRQGDSRRFVCLAAMSVVVRPTAAILWILMAAWHLQRCKGPALWSALRLYLSTGLAVLAVSTVIDRVWYGRWVMVHLNFLHFNVVSGGSGFYGRHPWHWYLSQGAPVILGSHLLPFVLGVRYAWHAKLNIVPLLLILWHSFILSLLAHKEFRFLLPVLPLAMHYCGLYFHSASQPPPSPSSPSQVTKGGGGELSTQEGGGGGKNSGDVSQDTSCKATQDSCAADPDRDTGGVHNCWNTSDKETNREDKEVNGEASEERQATRTVKERSRAGKEANRADSEDREGRTDTAGGKRTDGGGGGGGEGGGQAGRTDGRKDAAPFQTPHPYSRPPLHSGEGRSGEEEADQQRPQSSAERGPTPSECKGVKQQQGQKSSGRRALRVRCLMLFLALTNLPLLLYFSLIHQRGTMDVMTFLHQAALKRGGEGGIGGGMEVLFLMPCHSTPFYSHLHLNVSLTFLTCEPNLQHVPNYIDEADRFYHNPARWLAEHYGQGALPLPSHLVYYNGLAANITEFLQAGRYGPCAHFFHTHLPEGRVGSHVLVSCREGR
ncbi:hypothetical protein ACOMHN_014980 [Nucella lapillus]